MNTAEGNGAKDSTDVERTLKQLPGGREPLDQIVDPNAKALLTLAGDLLGEARKSLGSNTSKPRARRVEELFERYAGPPRQVPTALDKAMRRAENVEQVAVLDNTWDKAYASADNKFSQVSVAAGTKIQAADDNWRLAVRIFESELRSAGAILKSEIDKAKAAAQKPLSGGDDDARIEVEFYSRASDISKALVTFEQAAARASGTLATAFGALVSALFEGATATAVGEAQLLNTRQVASMTFWTGIQAKLGAR